VCEALEQTHGLQAEIKWPNDVLLQETKVCGVLPEAHWTGEHLQALILGIGINVAAESVPPAKTLSFPATSVEVSLGRQVDAGSLLRSVLERILGWKDRLSEPSFISAWDERLAYKGEQVSFSTNDHAIEAELIGLAADGSLRLKLSSGEVRSFQMGEIRIRPRTVS
jgi:BirA family biotin operon repressor/biotin-[acetyl-CoA-carboxylase] ligase